MIKRFSTLFSIAALSLALTVGVSAQENQTGGGTGGGTIAQTGDDDDDDFDWGLLGLLGLLGLAGLIPRKNHDRDRHVGTTTATRT